MKKVDAYNLAKEITILVSSTSQIEVSEIAGEDMVAFFKTMYEGFIKICDDIVIPNTSAVLSDDLPF